jgi:hypothetical protein
MEEPRLVVEHREELIYLLVEAAVLEHMVMLQYLYATFSLKQRVDEGLTPEQLAAVERWRKVVDGITVQEMLHLALASNLLAAVGMAPTFTRPSFPQGSRYFPPRVEFRLLPFGEAALRHSLFLERPEGMDLSDAAGIEPSGTAALAVGGDEIIPRREDFATVGHLYRGIAEGFRHLAGKLGEERLFVGPPRAQATPALFRWPELLPVTDLASALAAIEEIVEQGEGARGHWEQAHYGRLLGVLNEFLEVKRQDPAFEPARPVVAAVVRLTDDAPPDQPVLDDPSTSAVMDVFNVAYEMVLQTLVRLFTHTDESDEQLDALATAAVLLMATVLRPLGNAITELPAGPSHPGRTAGPSFELFYQMGNFIPDRRAAWTMLVERLGMLAALPPARGPAWRPGRGRPGRRAAEVDRRPARQAAACLSLRFLAWRCTPSACRPRWSAWCCGSGPLAAVDRQQLRWVAVGAAVAVIVLPPLSGRGRPRRS